MVYRLVMISFVAFVILGMSSIFYAHYIDVRDAEARILARDVVDCISPEGVLNLNFFSEEDSKNILSYCGFDSVETERFFVRVFVDELGKEVAELSQGDSGKLWILEIFENERFETEGISKYKPGYFSLAYPVHILDGEVESEGEVFVEVMVSDEF